MDYLTTKQGGAKGYYWLAIPATKENENITFGVYRAFKNGNQKLIKVFKTIKGVVQYTRHRNS